MFNIKNGVVPVSSKPSILGNMDFDHEVLFRVQCSFSWQKWDYVLAIPSNKDWE